MEAKELVSLVKHMAEREIDRDENGFVGKLRQTDFREQEDRDAFESVVTALGLEDFLDEIGFNLQTDMKKPDRDEEEEEETQLDETMAEWVQRLRYLNETQHRRG